jgi:outer membrane protein OmpA-like peptidoglycan-associated protein
VSAGNLAGEELPMTVAGIALIAGLAQAFGAASTYAPPAVHGGSASTDGKGALPLVTASTSLATPIPANSLAPANGGPPSLATPCPPIVIPFALGVADLDGDARRKTRALAVWATSHPEATFVFDGHADARGDEIDNLRLSKLRSSKVSAIFQSLNIDKSRLTARGFGTFVPAGGVAEDRRVAITILGGACPPAEGVPR